jgi:hypothetical protein
MGDEADVHSGIPHVSRRQLPCLAQDTLKNFNANPGQRADDYTARMLRLLQAAW